MTKHELTIQNMSCQHCVKSVRDVLERIPGVKAVRVAIGSALVETTDDVERSQLRAALAAVEYPAD